MTTAATAPRKLHRLLYVQVLAAIVIGAAFGALAPEIAASPSVEALGKGFVKLIKMVIAPIIFCTVVSGIAHIESAAKVGRVGVKALVYFEAVSTLALALGLLVGNLIRPGAGFAGKADAEAVAKYLQPGAQKTGVEFVLDIIPDSVVGAFAKGDILASAAVLDSVRLRADGDGRARPGAARRRRRSRPCACSASSPS